MVLHNGFAAIRRPGRRMALRAGCLQLPPEQAEEPVVWRPGTFLRIAVATMTSLVRPPLRRAGSGPDLL